MIAYGWNSEQIEEAVRYLNNLYAPEGGVAVEVVDFEVKAHRCQRGNSTLKFSLRFLDSTARRSDGSYPPGVGYKAWMSSKLLPKQPVPTPELINERSTHDYRGGCEVIAVERTRSCGHLCWHAFGHFMAKMFDLNATGKLVTVANTYEGRNRFVEIAIHNKTENTHNCQCWDHDLTAFINIRG